ncbi:histidine--tRNA ligase [Ilumatobacter nonamiensis]|uniref:histidine--tRNA ligase n=1 Tax=Ilumatobacter nonamiensis TaxID=467093 RepID=UPI0011D23F4C|nr:histidine--tRNA ligase [Ilumatobacter nonamiensis]
MPAFQTSPGMRDILPADSARWRRLNGVFAEVVEAAGYGQIITPLLEDIGVFTRIGDATDVVTKEMYAFEDLGGRQVALRPEMTAAVCRSFAQHRPTVPWKVWYTGSNFRYEKPQRGRFRQFDQVGVEVLGVDDANLDVEVIALASEFFQRLGLRRVKLIVNSLGEPEDRARYVEALAEHFEQCDLSEQSRATLTKNPLRVLDSKREQDAGAIATAPKISEFYSAEAAEHFATVCAGLDRLAIDFEVEPTLVRGLDYYRRTIFEFQGATLDSAQNALGGGGRYDGLVEALGGPATPGIGFALGVDRTLLACEDEGVFASDDRRLDAFVVDVVGGGAAVEVTAELRAAGLAGDRGYDNRSMKAQMKLANRSGAAFALIVGEDEDANNTVVVKPMARDAGEQQTIPRTDLISHLQHELRNLR